MGLALVIFVTLLLSTFCWFICSLYIAAINKYYGRKIENSTSSLKSVSYRKRYNFLIKIERLMFALMSLIGCACIADNLSYFDLHNNDPFGWFFWVLFGICELYYVILMNKNIRYTIVTNISGIRTIEKKRMTPYVLFLRGFDSDDYTMSSQAFRKRRDRFSEHLFLKRLSLMYQSYAIGRPEELIAPSGATRIYLDNETWQQDVRQLMDEAACVVILVNDRPNCIWEIAQTQTIRNKTIYIVNNKMKYYNVAEMLPKLDNSIQDLEHFFIWYNESGQVFYRSFTNTGNSYWNIIRVIQDKIRENTLI